MQIFQCADTDGDTLTITKSANPDYLKFCVNEDGAPARVHLVPERVTELRRALQSHDPEVDGDPADADVTLVEVYRRGWVAGADAVRDEALQSHEDLTQAYLKGRQDAIDDYDYISREEHHASVKASHETGWAEALASTLDARRVAALEKATELAKELRSSSVLVGNGAISCESVVALALFLLNELPMSGVAV